MDRLLLASASSQQSRTYKAKSDWLMIIIHKEIVFVIFASLRARCSRSHPQKNPQKNFRKNAEEVKKKRSRWIDPSYWCLSCSTQQSHINTNKTKIRQKCESIVCRLWAKGGEQSCRIALCSDRKKKKKRDQISWGALLASPLFIGWQVQRKQHGMI